MVNPDVLLDMYSDAEDDFDEVMPTKKQRVLADASCSPPPLPHPEQPYIQSYNPPAFSPDELRMFRASYADDTSRATAYDFRRMGVSDTCICKVHMKTMQSFRIQYIRHRWQFVLA